MFTAVMMDAMNSAGEKGPRLLDGSEVIADSSVRQYYLNPRKSLWYGCEEKNERRTTAGENKL